MRIRVRVRVRVRVRGRVRVRVRLERTVHRELGPAQTARELARVPGDLLMGHDDAELIEPRLGPLEVFLRVRVRVAVTVTVTVGVRVRVRVR